MDCSPPGSSVHGIFQARTLEWLPFPSPGDLPNLGLLHCILYLKTLPANSGDARDVEFDA